ncbi:D-glycerate dehydrogenase [Acinetobacter qingfengensis]|uniref:Bifunctional glyoxylate/hydroxypyruvate reductase B n=1 Tax=Acinetobacter qingfengensis TaxID=1262585 RepID=A0A1E7RD17_9GAMM|nr:D-glycerate dehydrogenase [Acinetobacter qingfengensis]KAA8734978.1 D-glycerate dehydrogenase [Acinetobacter qingfengensis]OEY97065.1 bifunctional glyoxylate/hydroxypyruvate reductase B [Acinetobacter qingfengensis]
MKKKVVIFSNIFPEFEEKLKQQFEVVKINPKLGDVDQQIRDAVQYAHGMIGAGRRLGASQLETASQLEIISTVSVGYDNYDVAYLKQKGILLAHTPHVLTETTADTAFTLLVSAARRVVELDGWARAGHWQKTVSTQEFGVDIHAKTLGIIGLGNIGAAIARRGYYGFNMNVVYHGRQEKPEIANAFNARFLALDELLQQADFVVVTVDLNETTRHLLSNAQFAKMQKHAVLVNISRGAVIDEQALIHALQQKQIFAAGLDVFEHEPLQQSPLFELDNVVITPHIGSATLQTRQAMNQLAYDNLVAQLTGKKARYLVN